MSAKVSFLVPQDELPPSEGRDSSADDAGQLVHKNSAQTPRSTDQVHADLKAGVKAHILRKKFRKNQNGGPVDSATDAPMPDADEGDEEDEDDEPLLMPRVRKVGENRRRQNAIFESYLQQQARKLPEKSTIYDEEEQPTKYLVRQTQAEQIISSPREYQIELFERAKNENIIAVLDTGNCHLL